MIRKGDCDDNTTTPVNMLLVAAAVMNYTEEYDFLKLWIYYHSTEAALLDTI